MKKNIYWLIILTIFGISVVSVLLFNNKKDSSVDLANYPFATPTSSVQSSPIDLTDVANLSQVKATLQKIADNSYFYKIDWTHISEINVNGEKMYFGELDKVSGNGKLDQNPQPFFLVKGIFYVPNGYGGSTYDFKDTNWINRYKDLQFSDFMPFQLTNTPITPGSLDVFKVATGIDSVSMSLDKDGEATKISVKLDGQDKALVFEGSLLTHINSINLLTVDNYKDFPDYNAYQERYRKLPGNVTEKASYIADTGYSIVYPSVINGSKVTRIHDYEHSDSFYIDDQPSDPDTGRIFCYQNDQQQVGPQEGNPDAIAEASRTKLINWGVSHEYHRDIFSFTGPGYYCQLQTSGTLRPNMFEITF